MATKSWPELTTDEKLNHLYESMVPREQFEQLRKYVHTLEGGISEAHAKIETLEDKLKSSVDGGKF